MYIRMLYYNFAFTLLLSITQSEKASLQPPKNPYLNEDSNRL